VKLARPPVSRGPDEDQARQPPAWPGFVESIVNTGLGEFLEENPSEGRRAGDHEVRSGPSRARGGRTQGARSDEGGKSALENSTLPGKLADCSVKDPRPGRACSWSRAIPPAAPPSRVGTATRRRFLPLRGKILNVEKSRIDKVLQETSRSRR